MPGKSTLRLPHFMPFLSKALPWVILIHTLLFGLFWLTNRAYQRDVNAFLVNALNLKWNYIAVFLGFSLLVFLCSLAWLGISAQTSLSAPPLVNSLYSLLAGVYLVFFYGTFFILFRQDPTQLYRLLQMIAYFRIFSDALLMLGLAWMAGRVVLPLMANRLPPLTALIIVFLVQSGAWCLPLLFQPGNVYIGHLPARPRLIAHRGAAWLAPENTLSAMQRAIELDVFGLESDVHISLDGVPFLMHDATLQRTTDVATVFPERAADPASSFSWSELSQLNAGCWFTEKDPYGSLAADRPPASVTDGYAQEKVAPLQTLLEAAAQSHKIVLFDLYDPPQGHPYHNFAFQRSLETLDSAQLGKLAWILALPDQVTQVRALLPKAILVAGIDARRPPAAADLLSQGFQVVNSEYPLADRAIQDYGKAGLWVNLWTVDETWQYSRLWLLGADSVTSNNVHTLKSLDQPVMALTFIPYLLIWAITGLLAAFTLYSCGAEQVLKSW